MNEIELLEHNLRVERESRDHFYRELIQADVVIQSLKQRLDKCERTLARQEK